MKNRSKVIDVALVFLLLVTFAAPAAPADQRRKVPAKPAPKAQAKPAPSKSKAASKSTASKKAQKPAAKSSPKSSRADSRKKSSRDARSTKRADARASKRRGGRDDGRASKTSNSSRARGRGASRRGESQARSRRGGEEVPRAAAPPRRERQTADWTIGYTVRVADPGRRLVEVDTALSFAEGPGPVDLVLTDVDGHYTPGYAQFVESVALAASDGTPVELSRPTVNRWRPARALEAGQYRLRYSLRIDHPTKPSAWGLKETPQLDAAGGVLIGAALFMVPAVQGATTDTAFSATPKLGSASITTDWSLPAGWRVLTPWKRVTATSMRPGSVDDLLDNFVVVGRPDTYEMFETRLGDTVITGAVRRGAWPFTGAQLWRAFESSIAQGFMVFGEMPSPAYLLVVDPWPGTKGQPGSSSGGGAARQSFRAMLDEKVVAADLATMHPLATLVHETFHWWNPTALPPAAPADFYWWHEGVTVYYSFLLPWRAGAVSRDTFLEAMLDAYERGERRNSARPATSLVEASRRISGDGGAEYDAVYNLGAVLAFELDVEIRRRSGGARSLDDLMKALYERHRRTKTGFTLDDLADEASILAGAPMREFFAKYVEGHDRFDWDRVLAAVGYREAALPTGKPYIGVTFGPGSEAPVVHSVSPESPATGKLQPGDVLVAVGAAPVATVGDFLKSYAGRRPGDTVELTVRRAGAESRMQLVLGERKVVRAVPATPQLPDARVLLEALGTRKSS